MNEYSGYLLETEDDKQILKDAKAWGEWLSSATKDTDWREIAEGLVLFGRQIRSRLDDIEDPSGCTNTIL